jgi:putative transposase
MARLVVPNYPHHVTRRGNRSQRTFFTKTDFKAYIALLSKFCRKAETKIWAYCLMPNHVHLVMVPSHENGLRASLGDDSFVRTLEQVTGGNVARRRPGAKKNREEK